MSETIVDIKKQQLVQTLAQKLSPVEQEKLKAQPKRQYYPRVGLRSFKLSYSVDQLTVNTEIKIKSLDIPKDQTIYEKNRLTGNKVKAGAIDKSTGKRLEHGYGFSKFDEITGEQVMDNNIQLVQVQADPLSATGVKEVEVSKFSKTDTIDISDTEIIPRQSLNDWIIEKEYEIYGSGSDLYKIAKSLIDKKAVGGIREFTLVESNTTYKAFLVPPPVLVEDRFYFTIRLARRKREGMIKSYLNANDTVDIKPKKVKTGAKIEVPLDDF